MAYATRLGGIAECVAQVVYELWAVMAALFDKGGRTTTMPACSDPRGRNAPTTVA